MYPECGQSTILYPCPGTSALESSAGEFWSSKPNKLLHVRFFAASYQCNRPDLLENKMVKLMSVYVRCLVDFDPRNGCNLVPTVFLMAWENEIQVPFTFFVFAWHWKTDLNFAFCFSFSANFENWIWTSSFIFRFCITLKNGIWISFLVYAFLWKTDLNFVSRFRITLKNGFEFRFSFLYGLFSIEKQIWILFVVFARLKKRPDYCS